MSGIKDLFKSKEQKQLEAKLAVKHEIRELERSDKSLQKKIDTMLKQAADAKAKGLTQQYKIAYGGLKMFLAFKKNVEAMLAQIRIVEELKSVVGLSSQYVKLLGKVGSEVRSVASTTDFSKNLTRIQQGIDSGQNVMGQLEDMIENMTSAFDDFTEEDDEKNAELRALIDNTQASSQNDMDKTIEEMIRKAEEQRDKLKE